MLGLQRRTAANSGQVVQVQIDSILPNRHQPRKTFDPHQLEELANSIRENGIIQPILVRYNADQKVELVSGERRLRASKLVGMNYIPCIFIEIREQKSAVFALLENIQRSDLNFFEEAEGIERLITEFGYTQEMCAAKLGKAQSTLSNKLRLLRLDPSLRQKILDHQLTERHARALLKLPTHEEREVAFERILQDGLNVSMTEKMISQMLRQPKKEKRPLQIVKDVRIFLNSLNRAVEMMRSSGIDANSSKTVHEEYIEYVVRIPKKSAYHQN